MDAAQYAEQHGLRKVGGRPPLGTYLALVWKRRVFIYSLSKFRIQAKNQRARLGMWWVIVTPILNAIVYGLVFGLIQGDRKPENFVQFLVIGVFIFQYFSSSLSTGAKSITSNAALVQSLRFPRMVLPLASVTQQFLNFIPMLAVMVIVNIIFGSRPSWSWLYLIPLLILITLFNTGISLFTARLTVHFRDLSQIIPFITRLMFYTSGIFFQIRTILEQWDWAIRAYDFHPLHVYLTIGRGALIDGVSIPGEYWVTGTLWAVSLAVIGVLFFWRAEERYGRDD